ACICFFFQAEDGIRDRNVTGVQTCALPIFTYGNIIAVHPFGNLACLVEVSGQQILDALELGSMQAGVSESGGFLQVSGIKYTVRSEERRVGEECRPRGSR